MPTLNLTTLPDSVVVINGTNFDTKYEILLVTTTHSESGTDSMYFGIEPNKNGSFSISRIVDTSTLHVEAWQWSKGKFREVAAADFTIG